MDFLFFYPKYLFTQNILRYPFWQAVSKINPIVYMISGFRYGFLGTTDVPIMVSITILILFIIVLYAICYYLVDKGKGLRS